MKNFKIKFHKHLANGFANKTIDLLRAGSTRFANKSAPAIFTRRR